MQQLPGKLVEHNYIESYRNCENSEIVADLIWTHTCSLDLLFAFPPVLIMDCTYKISRYRISLLEIVGVTSTDMAFSVCFEHL